MRETCAVGSEWYVAKQPADQVQQPAAENAVTAPKHYAALGNNAGDDQPGPSRPLNRRDEVTATISYND